MHYSNRASIMTGQYASRQGVIDNVARDAMSHRLPNYHLEPQRLGYATAHIGKWHVATSLSARTSRPPSSTRGRETRTADPGKIPAAPVFQEIREGFLAKIVPDRMLGRAGHALAGRHGLQGACCLRRSAFSYSAVMLP
jgi:N-acetylglucosamine-6-sulfatase